MKIALSKYRTSTNDKKTIENFERVFRSTIRRLIKSDPGSWGKQTVSAIIPAHMEQCNSSSSLKITVFDGVNTHDVKIFGFREITESMKEQEELLNDIENCLHILRHALPQVKLAKYQKTKFINALDDLKPLINGRRKDPESWV